MGDGMTVGPLVLEVAPLLCLWQSGGPSSLVADFWRRPFPGHSPLTFWMFSFEHSRDPVCTVGYQHWVVEMRAARALAVPAAVPARPRKPPSFFPRALLAAKAAFVRAEIIPSAPTMLCRRTRALSLPTRPEYLPLKKPRRKHPFFLQILAGLDECTYGGPGEGSRADPQLEMARQSTGAAGEGKCSRPAMWVESWVSVCAAGCECATSIT
jgi:hypothetical protein